jgi:hypothetical protein
MMRRGVAHATGARFRDEAHRRLLKDLPLRDGLDEVWVFPAALPIERLDIRPIVDF